MRPAVWAVCMRSLLSGGGGGGLALRVHGSPYEDWLGGVDGEAEEPKYIRSRGSDPTFEAAVASAGAELAKAAPEALSGMHVVMIGESVARYQYLNLAYHVMAGAPPPFEFFEVRVRQELASSQENYSDFWKFWYNWTNSKLQSPRSRETCDCYRNQCCSDTVENRYFSAKTHQGAPAHITFLQWFSYSLKGHWAPSDGYPIRTHCKPGECAPPFSFEFPSVEQLLRDVVAELQPRPTHVLMNKGTWGALSNASLEALFGVGHALSERHGIKFIWKTTLKSTGSVEMQEKQADMETRLARQHGWQVLDAWGAGRAGLHSYLYDKFHAKEAASAYINWKLLKML